MDVQLEAQPGSGLKESGDMVSKSQVLGLKKCVEELERALGGKALEADVLKQVF